MIVNVQENQRESHRGALEQICYTRELEEESVGLRQRAQSRKERKIKERQWWYIDHDLIIHVTIIAGQGRSVFTCERLDHSSLVLFHQTIQDAPLLSIPKVAFALPFPLCLSHSHSHSPT